jgi:hypothetical protein
VKREREKEKKREREREREKERNVGKSTRVMIRRYDSVLDSLVVRNVIEKPTLVSSYVCPSEHHVRNNLIGDQDP